ncbi:MAG: demethoxyubiquinone hydroxylase family protein [Rickettsiaceae bacterium H1]|nr:demethoxyubiquinone hydroxylase family protein [Rickettsiaceae bacterium H1]
MKSPLAKSELIKQMIRVNHAGEYAAMKIYKSQAQVFKKDKDFKKLIDHMKEQERHHLEYFTEALDEHKVKPTKFLPVWNVFAKALGYGTAFMGKKAAMASTVAVEEVISDHYQEQIEQLDEGELKETIKRFRQEEMEHHDIGIENKAEETKGYEILSGVIKFGCKFAIALSKRV